MDHFSQQYPPSRDARISRPAELSEQSQLAPYGMDGYPPGYPSGYLPDGGRMGGGGRPGGTMLVDYYRVLRRWRWTIAATALGGVVLALLLTLGSMPVYQARTSLDIQSINGDFMNRRDVAMTGDSAGAPSDTYIQTQIKLLQSDTLMERTVARLKSEPHPAAVERQDLISRIKRSMHLAHSEPLAYDALVADAADHIKVKPLGLTRLVEITCSSWDAQFSATFCNTLVSEYKAQDQDVRGKEAETTSEWLTRQLADIKAKYEASARQLEAAGGDTLPMSQEGNAVSEERLRQMQAELVQAEGDRMAKEAMMRLQGQSSSDTLPSVQDSTQYRADQSRLADLQAEVAKLVPPLTEENPRVIHLRAQIREAEAAMSADSRSSTGRVTNEYSAAVHREALLRAAYASAESSVSGELKESNKITLLKREVDGEQQLYQTLLQRAREAGFASAMQVSTIRVVDAAKPPFLPVTPRRSTAGVLGLLLGAMAGIAYAFLKERNTEVFRSPGEAERYLQVHELGVIPSAVGVRKGGLILSRVGASRGLGRYPLATEMSDRIEGQRDALAIAGWNESFSIVAEAYRNATYSILLADTAGGRARMYVVSSPNASEGKTTVTSNLGVALARSKRRVVLVDGDLRKPGLNRAFDVPNTHGLRDILRGETSLVNTPIEKLCQPTAIPNLSVVTAGTGSEEVVEMLHSPRLSELLARLSQEFDIVLIDTPPMLHMADARIFAGHVDGAILVLRAGTTSRDQATTARDLFEHDRVRMVGTILNGFDPASEGRGSYYRSYYQYKRAAETSDEAALRS